MLSDKPGLEVLRLFHLDESRHTALPDNYFKAFPMTAWEAKSPGARMSRLVTGPMKQSRRDVMYRALSSPNTF